MSDSSMFVGMDVHQKTIDLTVAEEGRDGRVWHFGTIAGDLRSVDRAVDKLLTYGRPLHFVYEAGPCGFVLHRHSPPAVSTAPWSPPPRSPPNRPTASRPTAVTPRNSPAPTAPDNCARSTSPSPPTRPCAISCAPASTRVERGRKARQQLNSFLLRHGRRYTRSKWTAAHRRWLSDLIFERPAQRVVFEESIAAIEECDRRVERLTQQIEALLPEWRFLPVVGAVQALRGVSLIVAVTMIAELGDLRRFTPSSLMQFIGMVPSRVLHRRAAPPRSDHQVRQCACAPRALRGGVGLRSAAGHQPPPAARAAGPRWLQRVCSAAASFIPTVLSHLTMRWSVVGQT